MRVYHHAIPSQNGAHPLGGSRVFRFHDVQARRRDGAVDTLADADTLARLSAPRRDISGLTLDVPRVMGILNVTPDSFSDGGDNTDLTTAVDRARAMAKDADILDIGGESTRPGAAEVGIDEEIRRTAPVIAAIRSAGIQTPISIDTRKARVAEAALKAGANIVNDVSALTFDPNMAALVAERDVAVCLMHAQGDPEMMQADPRYDNVLLDVFDWLERRIVAAEAAGIARDRIIVDPGIGFGKTLQHNLSLLRGLSLYHDLGLPILLGASRKRFIGTIDEADEAKDRMAGSVAVALHAAAQGAQILRVHDTYETRQALRLQLALSEVD
ncbi:dihydropteroate synthase [Aliiroseovarius subalbicans]|uniref:dihydropteroate synthase n=1 Tax=Aliiroseovarius subalbicans TaxID=2925840 RepID=UPI001F5896A0|nr:dihydropteroate synthase [Aliiroseovarius subalbicans]MCI2399315.1 dihydropteroate synthase [Aliiroseovarius subalbicans]